MGDKPIIIALDVQTKQEAENLVATFGTEKLFMKVGMELYFREGFPILEYLKTSGHRIFLDLKLHDIPTTVKRAMKQLASFEVDMVNVHALGGSSMMEAALEGLDSGTPQGRNRPDVIAVTQLTSTTSRQLEIEQAVSVSLEESVMRLAQLTKKSNMDGVVCSAKETEAVKKVCGENFLCVTPGIRLLEDTADDQARIVTPGQAAQSRTDAIVVGRGITRKADPLEAYLTYKKEWEEAWKQQQL